MDGNAEGEPLSRENFLSVQIYLQFLSPIENFVEIQIMINIHVRKPRIQQLEWIVVRETPVSAYAADRSGVSAQVQGGIRASRFWTCGQGVFPVVWRVRGSNPRRHGRLVYRESAFPGSHDL
jgi:hypothetical protein